MNSSSSDTCEYCGPNTRFTERSGKTICDNCGLLRESTLSGIEPVSNPTGRAKPADDPVLSEVSISYKDSSEEKLGEMVLSTESLVRELVGDDSQCVHAVKLLSEAWKNDYFRGRSSTVGIASIVYLSFQINDSPRPLSIVSEMSGVPMKQLRRGVASSRTQLGLFCNAPSANSYIEYIALILEVEKGVILEGLEILEEAPSISGNPAGIAAAALYLAGRQSDAPFTLSDAGVAAGVTKETVWRKSKEIRLARNSLE